MKKKIEIVSTCTFRRMMYLTKIYQL
uniref:Uncharacterized protein n=1 Tax=Rhizophora mucronata TaxID=61149 RepID=A0A2P2NHX0_RHIMU